MAALPADVRVPDVALIGRDAETRALEECLARARDGDPQVVVLEGESGSGKTALLQRVLGRGGHAVLWGQTSEFASSEFGPVKDMMRRLRREDPSRFAATRTTHRILDVLLPEGASDAPLEVTRDALFASIVQLLLATAANGPAVLVFDDVHVADHATVQLLAELRSAMRQEPLLLVLAHRSDDLARQHPLRRLRQQWHRSRTGLTELSLTGLNSGDAVALAARCLGAKPSQALASDLLRLSGGNPLYIEELVAALADRDGIRQAANGDASAADGSLPVPESLREAVMVRMASLEPSTQRVLERAAVMGPEIDLDLLAATGVDREAAEILMEAHWLADDEPGKARFRHALLREAVYAQIPWTRRRQWHAEWAAALEAADRSLDATAEHWLAAHEHERARIAFLGRAARACAVHAHADALGFLGRALELWREGLDEDGRLDALHRLGDAAQLARRRDEAARAWNEVCERGARVGDWARVGAARRRLAVLWALAGEVERTVEEREAAAMAFVAAGQPREAAVELSAAADSLNLVSRWRSVLDVVERAWPLALEAGGLELQVMLQSQRGRATARMGRIDEGLADTRAALEIGEANGLSTVIGYLYQRLADCHEHDGRYASARDIFLGAAERCGIDGSPMQREACRACALAVLVQNGEWTLGLRIADEIVADPHSPPWARVMGIACGGWIQAMRGDFRSARPRLRDGLRSARNVGFRALEHPILRSLALCEWFEGKPILALEHAHAALKSWGEGEEVHHIVPTACMLATLFSCGGDSAGVAACVQATSVAAQATGQAEALAGLAYTMGESRLVGGAPAEAGREFATALQLGAHLPLPFWRASTLRRLAEAEVLQRQEGAAIENLRSAIDLFDSLDAAPFVQEATARLAALAPHALRPADERRQHAGLTPRQRQILKEVAHGCTDKEIARSLGLSPRTVEMHVGRLMATLRCRTRSEAVARAVEMKLLAS